MEPVAIVGIGCRFPDALDPAELWHTVLHQRRAFRRVPPTRLAPDYVGTPADPDLTYVTHAGLLNGWTFDREAFRVPGRLFRAADPTHWLALDTAAAALTDAGFPGGEGLGRDRCGVIIGNSLTGEHSRAATLRLRLPFLRRVASEALAGAGVDTDTARQVVERFAELVRSPFPEPDDETLAGALANTIAGRICNHFDFHGTGYTVDGACASSLLALVTACRALRAGELDVVLAGGVDVSLDPFELVGFSRLGALAVDRMRVYDARPTGFLPGEGCGVVVLMRASDADRRGLRAYAHVLGWGTSSDGAGGLTRPAASGQVLALRRALDVAGRTARELALVEGHGTGTAVGDRVELEVLHTVLDGLDRPAALGSVKANLGHTKAAAGVAGTIKAALAAHHGTLPPTTGCEQPHELLAREGAPVRTLRRPEPWPADRPLAGVSSMGFGGINAHLTLSRCVDRVVEPLPAPLTPPRCAILLLSAAGSAELARQLAEVERAAPGWSTAEMFDVAATAHGRFDASAPVRTALVAERPDQLRDAAATAVHTLGGATFAVRSDHVVATGPAARVGLLFPGQGSPVRASLSWWGDRVTVPATASPAANDIRTEVVQPAVVRQSLAGLAWLRLLRCQAVAAAGHSLGEITALAWAGAISPATALRLARRRGEIMARFGRPGTGMVSVACPAAAARELISGTGLAIAGHNATHRTTVSGRRDELRELMSRCRANGVHATELPVSHGFHSAAMAPARDPLLAELAGVEFGTPSGTVFSTVTGTELDPGTELRSHLADQLTGPVLFTEALAALSARCDLLVEVGPGDVLTRLAGDLPAVSLDCGGDARRDALCAAALAVARAADLSPWFAGSGHRPRQVTTPLVLLTNPCEVPAAVEPPAAPRPAKPTDDPVQLLRDHLSRRLELPVETITARTSLLTDLHLNSLQVVQLFAEVAAELGRSAPEPVPVDATVGEAAEVLAASPVHDGRTGEDGVRPWVRLFCHDWEPHRADRHGSPDWRVHAPAGSWPHRLTSTKPGTDGLLGYLPPAAGVADVAGLVEAIAGQRPARLLLLHHGHPAALAVARSVAAARRDCATTVVELAEGAEWFDTSLAARRGYLELRSGGTERAHLRPLRVGHGAAPVLEPGDVCLVTGGGAGITALCAKDLADRYGCVPVVLGRSGPSADERYVRCDVTDPASVTAAVAQAARLGPVRGLLHGAAVNDPRPLTEVTAATLSDTLAPKVLGLRTLLAAAPDLALVVAFGSVIGAFGLDGQAEYAIANDWMRAETERWAAKHPGCRTHVVEWTAWAGLGMAARMASLDRLRRLGVRPIEPEEGAAALMRLLDAPDAPVTVLVTGRLPKSPTVRIAGPDPLPLRYCENVRTFTPGVEIVTEATLTTGSDPHLADHVIDGTPVLPAVLGAEAAAQVVATMSGHRGTWAFTGVALRTPVTVPPRTSRTIRVAALSDGDGADVRLTDDLDGFRTERMRMRVEPAGPAPAGRSLPVPEVGGSPSELYGPTMFHGGRFRRVLGYELLTAFRVRAWVEARDDEKWFGDFHPGDLLLGDAGAHDAAIHALLPCVPHRRALPTGIDRLTVWRRPHGLVHVTAEERAHTADDFVFDVEVRDREGCAVSRWEGLRLRATSPRQSGSLPLSLLGPYLSRRLVECGVADRLELVVRRGAGAELLVDRLGEGDDVTISASVEPAGGRPMWTVTQAAGAYLVNARVPTDGGVVTVTATAGTASG
ncbi:type I polyketide synthase [Nocardia sp. NRRL S-836]|uniref:type I polyketide synthase n=1 Tax=Nocardia sp. NRRL S-836 TaxID=1519492 RepID=UPI0006AFC2F1|nr:type I polyketide synthase [Nocardia sp. NRRL S-836]